MGREGTKAAIADIERIKIRDNQPQTGKADKAAPKGKKKKNRKTGKRAAINDTDSRRESEEEEEEISEDESPKKPN